MSEAICLTDESIRQLEGYVNETELNNALKDWGDEISEANTDGQLKVAGWVVAVSGVGGPHGRWLNVVDIFDEKDEATRRAANMRRTIEYREAKDKYDIIIHIRPLYESKEDGK